MVLVPRLDQAGLALDAVRGLEGIEAVDLALPLLLAGPVAVAGEAAVEGQEKAKCEGEKQRVSHGCRERERRRVIVMGLVLEE